MSSDEASWGFQEGDEIQEGRFALKRLGGGSSYEVYISWDDGLACPVVAKLLRPDLVDDDGYRHALRREADVLARLSHPVILRIFDASLDGERPHLLLEYLEGETLRHLIRFGSVPIEQLLPLTLSLCSAIQYLHSERVVHLDIKSRNIVMGVPPRLIDFSIARSSERAAALTDRIGTDAYMAPEQCDPQRRGSITPAADIWGLGATLFRAANGYLPFPRPDDHDPDNPDQRFPQLWQVPQDFRPEVPGPFRDAVLACLNPDPELRPEPMELAASLEGLVALLPRHPVLRRFRRSYR